MSGEATPKIQCRELSKAFGSNRVLHGLDLTVAPGESLVVIGGSGTGKSVLIKAILGIVAPDAGDIRIDGGSVVGLGGHAHEQLMRRFGMLFQNGALFDSLPVWRNVAFALIEAEGVPRREAYRAAVDKLAQVGMTEDVARLFPAELSGGMKKRVGLARAVATDPEILFFDEPTTGLDPITGDVINDLILRSAGAENVTTLSITHDIGSARKIADRVAMLHHGRIIWHGTVAEMDATDDPYVRQFIEGRADGPIGMPAQGR